MRKPFAITLDVGSSRANHTGAIMGRVCYRPCETACNRAQLDAAVGINSVERFLGDEALRQGWQVPVDCPDNAIVKLGDGQYEIDYDYCKGCGLCAAECPCGAIQLEPEPS